MIQINSHNFKNYPIIGKNCNIAPSVSFINPKNIFIGDNVVLEDSVLLDAENGKGIFIGNNTIIRRFTTILSSGSEYPKGFVKIGNSSHIGTFNYLTGHNGLQIGNNCLLAPYVFINGFSHNFNNKSLLVKSQGSKAKQILIGNDVYIAIRSSVISGCLEDGCVVYAHSLVNKKFKPFSIIKGQPAKLIKFRS